jgi:hypothetical protein
MDKDFLIKLTNNLYRITLLFPKKEPLRYKMRELTDEILAYLIKLSPEECPPSTEKKLIEDGSLSALEILDSFFEVAKEQKWVNLSQVLEIQQEYSKIRENLKKSKVYSQIIQVGGSIEEKPPEAKEDPEKIPNSNSSSNRQEKIMEVLKEKGKAQVWEIKIVFPEVSKRTLRRDFNYLVGKGLLERVGERNYTFYQLKEQGFDRTDMII